MSGFFSSDDIPRRLTGNPSELPAPATPAQPTRADQLVAAEQQRSEAGRIEAIQRQLRLETASRGRGFGIRSLLGSLGSGRSSLLGSG